MFAERLKQLRHEKGLTQIQFSKQFNVSSGTIAMWETGKRIPDSNTLVSLANFLNCSVDYLLGRSDDRVDESVLDLVNEIDDDLLEKYGNIRDALIAQAARDKAVTDTEFETIKKYRALDEHGAKVVDFLLDAEFERCSSMPRIIKIANTFRTIPYSNIPASAGLGEWLDAENMDEIEIPDTPANRSADFAVPVSGDSMMPTYRDGDILLIHEQDAVNVGDIGLFAVNGDGYVKEMGDGQLISHNRNYDNIPINESFKCFGKVIGKL